MMRKTIPLFIAGTFVIALSGCDSLKYGKGAAASYSDDRLINKHVDCISDPPEDEAGLDKCKSYAKECKKRNETLGFTLC